MKSQIKLFTFLWPYLKQFTGRIVLTLVILVLARMTNVAVPVVMKKIVDSLDMPAMLVVPVALLVVYGVLRFLTTLFEAIKEFIAARISLNVMSSVSVRVYSHIHELSQRFHISRETGRLVRDLERGIGSIMGLISVIFFMILPIIVEAVFVFAIFIRGYDYTFTLIVVVVLASYAAYTFMVIEWRMKYRRQMNKADSYSNALATDSILNYETVKYFGNEAHEVARFRDATNQRKRYGVYSSLSGAVLDLGQSFIIASGVVLIMWRATAGVVSGVMTIGDLVLVNSLMLQLSMPLHMLGMVYRTMRQSMADMERMHEINETEIEVADAENALPLKVAGGEVRFDKVSFHYESDREILHDISFTVPAGETVALVGHSGGGKSTISKLLFRFYDVTGGAIYIDGQDLRSVTQVSVRAAIGIVPQDTVLFNDTIGYNIGYGRIGATQEEIEKAARMAQLYDFIVSLPDGFDTVVGERGLKLSGGEKQRVAIARALLKNPPIYIFDEATSSLDSESERQIQAELDALAEGHTTVMIAHRLSTIMNADEILVIEKGRIAERGIHNDLLSLDGIYSRMWRFQQAEEQLKDSRGGDA